VCVARVAENGCRAGMRKGLLMDDTVRKHLGNQIRKYRKANKMTLDELAVRISKSKATVSKYESGQITLDIDTFMEISDVLKINASHLLQLSTSQTGLDDVPGAQSVRNHSAEKKLYMYFLDGRINHLVMSLLYIDTSRPAKRSPAYLHYHIESFDKPHTYAGFYTGSVSIISPYMNFAFKNANTAIEDLYIVAKETFHNNNVMEGLLTAISFISLQPISYKIILSTSVLEEDEVLMERLKISKEDMMHIRKENILVLSGHYDNFSIKSMR
jgi:transcriptional regulator with XRE-family HTH domain